MITWHKHHIVPKHAGGTDDPSNLLKCNIAMHAFMHEQLYKTHGRWQDKFASDMLKNGKGWCDWTGRTHKESTIDKMRESYVDIGDRNKTENAQRRCILPYLSNSMRDEGLSITQTASALGISVSSVKRYRRLANEEHTL